jgi:GT2 family glycosyltransferase
VIDQVGLFDPRFFMYYEEVDHCRRTKAAGWKVCFFPGSSVVHLGGESAKTTGKLTNTGKQLSDIQVESEILYFRKHYGFSGVFIHWVLFVLGASVVALKQGARRGQGKHAISYFLKKITQFRKVLVKTKFGRFPTR